MPKRIQRKRTKGWRMPEGAVYVGRPTMFGNPFWHAQNYGSLGASLRCYRMAAHGIWDPSELSDLGDGPLHVATKDFSDWMKQFPDGPEEAIRRLLHTKDLACWCPLDQPCHADVLLEIANPACATSREAEAVSAESSSGLGPTETTASGQDL